MENEGLARMATGEESIKRSCQTRVNKMDRDNYQRAQ